jgi:GNAT superfamily N-acetyltransferase
MYAQLMHLQPRAVTASEFDAALTTLAEAFGDDPVWDAWAFPPADVPDRARAARLRRELFAIWLRESLALDAVRAVGDCAAVAMWYPPGNCEDSDEYRAELRAFAAQLGPRADTLTRGAEMLAAHRPPGEYWYLALLAVRSAARGRGAGMSLLAACLDAPEFRGHSVYLESTNSRNTPKYARLGFAERESFQLPGAGGPSITGMWRSHE